MAEVVAALDKGLKAHHAWPPVAFLSAVDARGQTLVSSVDAPASPALIASFSAAIAEVQRAYQDDLGRPATSFEQVEMFVFVVGADPQTYLEDSGSWSGSGWRIQVSPVVTPMRCDVAMAVVATGASEVLRQLLRDAGDRPLIARARHRTFSEAAQWAKGVLAGDPFLEALSVAETEVPGGLSADELPPTTWVLRHGRIALAQAASGPSRGVVSELAARVCRLSEVFGSWVLGLELGPAPRVVGGFLGRSLGEDTAEDNDAAWTALTDLASDLGFAVADPRLDFGLGAVDTLVCRIPMPRAFEPLAPLSLGAICGAQRNALARLIPRPTSMRWLERRRADGSPSWTLVEGIDADSWRQVVPPGQPWAHMALSADGALSVTLSQGQGDATSQARGPRMAVEILNRLTILSGDTPGEIRWPRTERGYSGSDLEPPGLWACLTDLRPLASEWMAALPPSWVYAEPGTGRLDDVRWPARRDAELALLAAKALPEHEVLNTVMVQLSPAPQDLQALEAIVRDADRRVDDMVLDGEGPLELASAAADLARAHLAAARGLEAYSVHRELPSTVSTTAAWVVERALRHGLAIRDLEQAFHFSRGFADAPAWFWSALDESGGDLDHYQKLLHQYSRERLVECHAWHRDLATRLMTAAHLARLPAHTSDTTAFEAAAWVVTQGRAWYRAVVFDPALMPNEPRPGSLAERRFIAAPAAVHAERFDSELETDFEIVSP